LGKVLLAKAAVNVNQVVPEALRLLAEQKCEDRSTLIQAPMQLRAQFPRLDEGSLLLRNADLDGIVFTLPTLASESSDFRDKCDLFSPSPVARGHCRSPMTPSTLSA
jgi:hypothetical protein